MTHFLAFMGGAVFGIVALSICIVGGDDND